MANNTQTQQTAKPATVAHVQKPAAEGTAIEAAQAARRAEAARRSRMTAQDRFREDLKDKTNIIADHIDGQRGALLGIVGRGMADQKDDDGKSLGVGLTREQVVKSLAFIEKALRRVLDQMDKPAATEERFTL